MVFSEKGWEWAKGRGKSEYPSMAYVFDFPVHVYLLARKDTPFLCDDVSTQQGQWNPTFLLFPIFLLLHSIYRFFPLQTGIRRLIVGVYVSRNDVEVRWILILIGQQSTISTGCHCSLCMHYGVCSESERRFSFNLCFHLFWRKSANKRVFFLTLSCILSLLCQIRNNKYSWTISVEKKHVNLHEVVVSSYQANFELWVCYIYCNI